MKIGILASLGCTAVLAGLLGACTQLRLVPREQESLISLLPDPDRAVVALNFKGDGEPRRFILDTAATRSVLDTGYASRRGLVSNTGEKGIVAGVSGSAAFTMGWIRNAMLGRFAIDEKPAVLTNMSRYTGQRSTPFTGIIGTDVLAKYHVTVDGRSGRLRLSTGARPVAAQGACLSNLARAETAGLVMLPVVVSANNAAVELVGVLDTGAPQTMFNWRAMQALGISATSTGVRERPQVSQGFASSNVGPKTWLYDVERLRLANWNSKPFEARVSDSPIFGVLGVEERPAVIIGYDLLRQIRFLVTSGLREACVLGDSQKWTYRSRPADWR